MVALTGTEMMTVIYSNCLSHGEIFKKYWLRKIRSARWFAFLLTCKKTCGFYSLDASYLFYTHLCWCLSICTTWSRSDMWISPDKFILSYRIARGKRQHPVARSTVSMQLLVYPKWKTPISFRNTLSLIKTLFCNKWYTVRLGVPGPTVKCSLNLTSSMLFCTWERNAETPPPPVHKSGNRSKTSDYFRAILVSDQAGGGWAGGGQALWVAAQWVQQRRGWDRAVLK